MKTECAKIRNIICSASMMILLYVCGGCAAKQETLADTQQSVEMQSKPLSVLSSESDSMENPELNLERTTYDAPPSMFEFERDRIDQVTAFWNEADWQERGFYYDYVYTIRDGQWEYVAGGE